MDGASDMHYGLFHLDIVVILLVPSAQLLASRPTVSNALDLSWAITFLLWTILRGAHNGGEDESGQSF